MKFPRLPKALLRKPVGIKMPRTQDFKDDMNKLSESIAQEFKEKVVNNIKENTYGFDLAESTTKKKGSSVPLIDSGELVEAIFCEGTKVSVEDSNRSDSELTNLELAMVHEYGTKDKHIPARPVWRNTYRDFRPDAKKMVVYFFEKKEKK